MPRYLRQKLCLVKCASLSTTKLCLVMCASVTTKVMLGKVCWLSTTKVILGKVCLVISYESSPWNLQIQRKSYVRFLRTRECLLIPLQIFFWGIVLVVLRLNAGKNLGLVEEKGREQATIDGLDAGFLDIP